jgi:hypothetical protein
MKLIPTWLRNTIHCHFLSKDGSIKVSERTTVILTRTYAGTNDFDAALRCVIDSFSFLAVIVANIVRVLLFELKEIRKCKE